MERSCRELGLTQSLCKAFEILDCFTPETPVLRIVDITKRVNMSQSNVSRLVNTMAACGYLEHVENLSCYQLGKKIVSLSSVALNHNELRKQALPVLFELEHSYGCGANLAIAHDDRMFYLAHVDSKQSPRMYTMVGYTNPMHCTAIGKVLLSSMSEIQIRMLLERTGMEQLTCHTVTSVDAMLEQIAVVRKRGYAVEYEERILGSACIAAPIRNCGGNVVAGLSLSGKFRGENLKTREQEAAAVVMEAAARISNKLGYL